MTLSEFAAVVRERIPTPAEFVALVRTLGWRLVFAPDGTPPAAPAKGSPLLKALVAMLGREPYRTQVRELMGESPPPATGVVPPAKRLREWLYGDGRTCLEDASWGWDDGHHAGGAWHWRYAGEREWRRTPAGVQYADGRVPPGGASP